MFVKNYNAAQLFEGIAEPVFKKWSQNLTVNWLVDEKKIDCKLLR